MRESSFLKEISELTEARVKTRKELVSFESLKKQVNQLTTRTHRFEDALSQKTGTRIIAEIKKKSPSLGVINNEASPVPLALKYETHGAIAVSVLTEPQYFGGDIENLSLIRKESPSIRILQKDFVIGPYQIYEARLLGADAVLLIVALLGEERTAEYLKIATSLGLSTLVEVHTLEELKIALKVDAKIIGINNRDLHTLKISLDVSRELVSFVPEDVFLVSESGIENAQQILELEKLGFDAFLVGSSLMKSEHPEKALAKLIRGTSHEG
jgi:indole-3-glycerol phosphate synthase